MRLEISPLAVLDVRRIAKNIAKDKPLAAMRWVDMIESEFLVILNSPLAFPLTHLSPSGFRKRNVGQYIIFFRALGDVVRIERVMHGMRDLPAHVK
ncbi:plasmid stabilization system protein [Terriglobus roseus DSM 18391]|uniref:Plasmid stabilization system protein n=1 Tax=Terriglobus roseus (strain DSM 18391 / NRRL B-41598 / KBS 63) TaxID=926566 RepID=I3ZM62_TERRK|nr:type II toxin-antitoxin system RelE/ParE family toxin [Terriglobus roseus]AFL90330.1 plasmid stabilization system protein [Terriglobus roseus DSM 18391]